jgi:hypothetical protein
MTITIATVISAIKRHLSIIGKRLYTKDGKNMFSDITLSSAEDTPILTQYINASVQNVEAMLKQFITASSYSASAINVTITNTRGDSDFQNRVADLIDSYVRLNSIGEYLSMVHPDLAKKYQDDALQRMEALVEYVVYKKPPTAPTYQYPSELTVSENAVDIGVGEEYDVKYSISEGAIDDIEIAVEDATLIDAMRTVAGFVIKGKLLGHTPVKLFSRHNKEVSATIQVYVTDQS